MRSKAIVSIAVLVAATQSDAMPGQRVQDLYNTLEQALSCDATSGYLKNTLAKEREHIREVWTAAGLELGWAMLDGTVASKTAGPGRRCLANFHLDADPEIDTETAAVRIGFELGEARACFAQLFAYQIRDAALMDSSDQDSPEQFQKHRIKVQHYALEHFENAGCATLQFPGQAD